ncbi:MAG: SHD1 domain-containing protein [Kiritimatiellia bacterium]|jgi:Cu/Ag efflux protein CusF|nr:SHD1 domain-containing protein [Kiritimatiellia bacterium]MDP6809594.1 SHD1 domain-containing protein [Kiritimatiellia bacterium]MDP7023555.1 SHD1 domain-containing protein [Kiritimatiellia bacterium]
MKQRLAVWLMAFAAATQVVMAEAEEAPSPFAMRTWTAASGAKVEAKLIDYRTRNVTLEKANGEKLNIPEARLSKEDQAFLKPVKAMTRTRTGDFISHGTDAARLPVFATGEWSGYYGMALR